ncbi:MAG: DUF3293 domain-containing protein [Pseudomonadota bacterium]
MNLLPATANPDHELLSAFVATEYRVLTEPAIHLRIGDVEPQLDGYSGPGGWIIITADNPAASIQSEPENRAARARLESRVQTIQTGAGVKTVHRATALDRSRRWPDEQGWLFGFDQPASIHALAREFNQLGVVIGAPDRPAMLWLYGDWPETLPEHVLRVGQ